MLSQTVEYALRSVVHLATSAPNPQTTDDIAAATQVPRAYLSKVLQALVKGNVVQSRRGIGGGVALAKAPEELTLLEVVNCVEPIQRIVTCPLNLSTHGKNLCPLHRRMDDALATLETVFGHTTVAQVLADRSGSYPLCAAPPSGQAEPARASEG